MNTSLYLWKEGPENGTALVLLHGFMGSSRDFSRLVTLLRERYLCIAIDLPGHGRSLFRDRPDLRDLTGFPSLSAMILEDLRSLGIDKFSLYGYSMGGRVAQSIALTAPELIGNLILESSSFGIEDEDERRERYRSDNSLFSGIKTREDFAGFLEKWYSLPLFSTMEGDGMKSGMIESKLNNDIDELGKGIRLMSTGNQPFYLNELARSNLPITFICGSEDNKYREIAVKAAGAVPGIDVVTVENASHNVHACFPGRIAREIERFLG